MLFCKVLIGVLRCLALCRASQDKDSLVQSSGAQGHREMPPPNRGRSGRPGGGGGPQDQADESRGKRRLAGGRWPGNSWSSLSLRLGEAPRAGDLELGRSGGDERGRTAGLLRGRHRWTQHSWEPSLWPPTLCPPGEVRHTSGKEPGFQEDMSGPPNITPQRGLLGA